MTNCLKCGCEIDEMADCCPGCLDGEIVRTRIRIIELENELPTLRKTNQRGRDAWKHLNASEDKGGTRKRQARRMAEGQEARKTQEASSAP